ncbi:MAG: hypothetical protein JXO51_08780 [Candidatus Aminicenantes bacterium]|nr:hypothetical protein [Candidatus Aminicenantes bacterium]
MKRMAIGLAVSALCSLAAFAHSMNLKFGLFVPSLQSDLWEVNLQNLTFDKADMINTYYAGEYEMFLGRNASLSFEIGSYTRNVYAQYRDYTFENDAPIFQNISLRLTPIEANLKFYPMGHRYRVFPFVGAGVELVAWTYQQWGDFINFENDSVNEGFAESRRLAVGLNARAGLVFRFQSRLAFALEAKYQHVKGRLSEYFEGFAPLDLGGFSANASINFYFR